MLPMIFFHATIPVALWSIFKNTHSVNHVVNFDTSINRKQSYKSYIYIWFVYIYKYNYVHHKYIYIYICKYIYIYLVLFFKKRWFSLNPCVPQPSAPELLSLCFGICLILPTIHRVWWSDHDHPGDHLGDSHWNLDLSGFQGTHSCKKPYYMSYISRGKIPRESPEKPPDLVKKRPACPGVSLVFPFCIPGIFIIYLEIDRNSAIPGMDFEQIPGSQGWISTKSLAPDDGNDGNDEA